MSRHLSRRKNVCAIACAATVLGAFSERATAGPIAGEPVALSQPDGRALMATVGGDEWFNWVSCDRFLIVQDSAGWWRYARLRKGGLYPGIARAGVDSVPPDTATQADVAALAVGVARPPGTWALPPTDKGRLSSGHILVVLVEFQDRALTTSDAYWNNLFFGTAGKTVRTYCNEVSNDQFDILPAAETAGAGWDGVVRVQLQSYNHYSGNHPDPFGTIDDRNRWIVSDALYETAPYVQYLMYDAEAPTGYITPDELHIFFVIAGYDHGYAGAACLHPAVHGHRWALGGTVPSPWIGGTYLCGYWGDTRDSGYGQVGELHGDAQGSHAATIGEICHELGHDLGLPDLYDATFASQGIGGWGLMGYGGWGKALGDSYLGETPVHMCAWSKDQLQFVTPASATGNQDYTLWATGTAGYNVLDVPTSDANQRFLIENRQLQGFDAGLYRWFSTNSGGTAGGGLAVWHVDSSVSNNNSWSHKMVDVEEANQGSLGYGELDTFPADPVPVQANRDHLYYAGYVAAFGNGTTPNSRLYSGASTNINVSSVSASGTAMKCYVATELTWGLTWSTYFGAGGGEKITGVGLDGSGSIYVCGQAGAEGVPTTAGAYDTSQYGSYPSFVAKFNSAGALVWSTLLETDFIYGTFAEDIAVDSAGYAFVTGYAGDNFPTTVGAYDRTYNGNSDAFVTKLNQAGSALVYSTYLGSFGQEKAYGVAIDSSGCAYIVGETNNSGFPRTTGPVFGGSIDAFVTKFNSTGSALGYSRFLGGSDGEHGFGIAVDSSGRGYVTGDTFSSNFPTTTGAFDTTYAYVDAYFTRLSGAGDLLYSTLLGAYGLETGYGVAADGAGYGYLTGYAGSSSFPTTSGVYSQWYNGGSADAFVTKVNPAPSVPLSYSTFLGGSVVDEGVAIALDGSNNAYVVGITDSDNFPTPGAYAASRAGGDDAFVAALSPDATGLLRATYLGGSNDEVATDIARDNSSGALYIVGYTYSDDFPTTAGAYDPVFNGGTIDGFIAKLLVGQATTSLVLGVPDGGEIWYLDQPVTIQWSSSGAGPHVDLELSRSGFAGPWELLAEATDNDGRYDWVVSGTISSNCVVRISDSSQHVLTDVSNAAFAITILGDLDGDGDVDLDDYAVFADCLAGPGVTTPPPGCDPSDFAHADLDGDRDVDLHDFAAFQTLIGG